MTTEKYINPFTDFGFKKLFSEEPNKELLVSFLNQLLPQKHQVADLSFTKTEQLSNTPIDRKAIFDLYCVSPSGERFIVELQKANGATFARISFVTGAYTMPHSPFRSKVSLVQPGTTN
ncbi:PD-(D/E)XK nuclease family transposase [Fibrella rubiginis]|uniref:PD-(D/E)XK nuclease family transposase n=1 Tax=Fibrella rubiginis TaxID=2817060 RepID=UPI00286DB500|nr:PD-(D/E)XK nuclease family transposase [Fibrella rubiginis]